MACTICFNNIDTEQFLSKQVFQGFCEILVLQPSHYKEELYPQFCIDCSIQLTHISQVLTQLKLLQEEIEKFKENVKERICQFHVEPNDTIDNEHIRNVKRIRFKISKDLSLIQQTSNDPNFDNETTPINEHVLIKTENEAPEYEYETPESILPFDAENEDYEDDPNYEVDGDDDNYEEDEDREQEDSSELSDSCTTNETSRSNFLLKMEAMNNCSVVKIKRLENMSKMDIDKEMSSSSRVRKRKNYKSPPVSEKVVQLAMSSISKIQKKNEEFQIYSPTENGGKTPFMLRTYSRKNNFKSTCADVAKPAISFISNEEKKKVQINKRKSNKKKKPLTKKCTEPDLHPCEVCDQTFTNQKELEIHKLEIHQNQIIQCTNCPKMFRAEKHMRLHYERQHTDKFQAKNNEMRVCPTCGKSFKLLGFHGHLRTHRERSVKCDICEKILKNKYSLEIHHKNFHSGKREQFICKNCGKIFTSKSYLTAHERQIHELDFKLRCKICHKGEQNLNNLKNHMRMHEAPSIKCPEPGCEKMYKTKSVLHQHMRVHTGEKPFKCRVCDKGFRSTSDRNKHETLHTPHIIRATCEICGKKFTHKAYLHLHLIWHRKRKEFQAQPSKT